MRLLLDNNLSPRMAERLETHGWDVVHVRDLGLQAARDEVVLADLLLIQLPALEPDLGAGCIVAIGEDSIRVRSLPLG